LSSCFLKNNRTEEMMIFEAFSERAVVCLLFCEKAVSQKKNKKKKSNMHASHVLLLKINTSHYITHTHPD
jgi:hypothetical protein